MLLDDLKREVDEYMASSDGTQIATSLVGDQVAATVNLIRCVRLAMLAGADGDYLLRMVRVYQLERAAADAAFVARVAAVSKTTLATRRRSDG